MSPAAQMMTALGFVKIGPLKGSLGFDLWEFRVERDASATVMATLPNTPDAEVSWVTQALVAAGEERMRNQVRYAQGVLDNLLRTPPNVNNSELS